MRRFGLLFAIAAGLLLAAGEALAQTYEGTIPAGSSSGGARNALASPGGGWNVGEFDCASGIGGEVAAPAGLPTLTFIAKPESNCNGRRLRCAVKVLGDGLTDVTHTYELGLTCNNQGTIEASFALDGNPLEDVTTGTFTFDDIRLISSEFSLGATATGSSRVPALSTWGMILGGLLLTVAAVYLIVLRS